MDTQQQEQARPQAQPQMQVPAQPQQPVQPQAAEATQEEPLFKSLFRHPVLFGFLGCFILITAASGIGSDLDRLLGISRTATTEIMGRVTEYTDPTGPAFFSCIFAVIAAAVLSWFIVRSGAVKKMGYTSKYAGKAILFSLVFVIIFIVQSFGDGSFGANWDLTKVTPLAVLFIFMAGMVPGVLEEFVFRGAMMGGIFARWGNKPSVIWIALFLPALVFGLYHIQNLMVDISSPAIIFVQITSALGAGFLFGAVVLRTHNLLVPTLIHGLNDAIGFACGYFGEAGFFQATVDPFMLITIAIGFVVSVAVAFYLVRPSKHDEIRRVWREEAGLIF